LEYHFEHLQLVKCCLLENSKDETTRAIYKHHKDRVQHISSRWKAPIELAKLAPIVDHNLHFSGQSGHEGLGSLRSYYLANPTKRQRRSKTIEALAERHEDDHVRHASCLVLQGVWTKWQNIIPFDLSWANLIYGPGPRVISFLLNAQINSVRTPDMLKLWGYTSSAACKLCGVAQCTLHHLLVNCKFAREQGRYLGDTTRLYSILSRL